jgi:NAD(P)-dependent dehydrogenase (short-subunit alcohol dehydrogenase family)
MGSRSAYRTEVPGLGFYSASKAAVHTLGETLAVELAPFGIKVLIVEPGAFRTEGIYGQTYFTANPIPENDAMRAASMKVYASTGGTQNGDPDKAMEAVVDVVRGEGVAEGRPWPLYLALGDDAEEGIREKCAKLLQHLNDWGDVTRSMRFES